MLVLGLIAIVGTLSAAVLVMFAIIVLGTIRDRLFPSARAPRCFECGRRATEEHHVVPRSLGGSRTVPLCEICHGKAHGMERGRIAELTKAGLRPLKEAGTPLGAPRLGFTADGDLVEEECRAVQHILRRRADGASFRAIAAELGAMGLHTKRGRRWHGETVRGVWQARQVYAETGIAADLN